MKQGLVSAALVGITCLVSTGCKVHDFLYCEDDSYCTHYPGKTYCDVQGQYAESEGIGKTCIVPPFDAAPPVDALDLPDGPADMALLRMTPESWAVPAIDRGATGSVETFTVENRGGLDSGPVASTIAGPDKDSFTILSGDAADCASKPVPASSSCFVRVRFTPTGTGGPKAATLDVKAAPGGDVISVLSGEVHDCQPSTTMCVATSNSVVTCDAHGAIAQQQQCGAMGCDSATTVCLDVAPSNGLGAALDTSATATALSSASVALTVDTDAGTIKDPNGTVVASSTVTVPQSGAPTIRVFAFSSVSVGSVTVFGSKPLAIVSDGPITIAGYVDVSGERGRAKPGPGALSGGACDGVSSVGGAAAGGGGRESAGGAGGGGGALAGGQPYQTRTVEPLAGGCSGGSVASSGTVYASGGYGGGALQLVSRVSISLAGSAVIDAGGEGGSAKDSSTLSTSGSGGGTGGAVLLEAPLITLNGASVAIGARGGSGGAGGSAQPGADGIATVDGPAINACGSSGCGGNGGFASWPGTGTPQLLAPGPGKSGTPFTGGGGGSTGYAYFRTKTGMIDLQGGAVIRAFGGAGVLRSRAAK